MKKLTIYSFLLLSLAVLWGCEKGAYPGARISPYIAMFDVRNLYKGSDITLTTENMFGSNKITGVVVSDHSGGNMPEGLLVIQDSRRLSQLRGISIPIGAAAASYVPGDSVIVDVEGTVLKRIDGILQLTGVAPAAITKVASGITVPLNRVPANLILADPERYESTLSVIVKGGFNPLPAPTDVLAGEKVLNDGFGELVLHTETSASFANTPAPFNANYYGIVFNTIGADDQLVPQFRLRTGDDVVVLSSEIEVTPVIITGFMSDVKGGDGNYEYIQMMATEDIDFAATPYSVVVTNNANASKPTGFPVNGWGTGDRRTFKFDLTSGFAAKGSFFYVGGTGKMINGSGSTSMASSNWIRSFNYVNQDGDGFGTKTGGLFANSGNASGVAVFKGTTVNLETRPVDVIFVGSGGSLYTLSTNPPRGYRITNTDWYDVKNPITLEDQPFYRMGSNTLFLSYNTADQGYFNFLGGEYSPSLGRWLKARTQTALLLTKQSEIIEIEGEGATILR
ncbi:DUF5689 domain-containing protein [Chitinophaga sp. XS-30]|uniref:DUF5689 domain-containing protein n=1 Tax=Chitinophaga sp. XS-30 TaxID=2604421 RepID=UPI0011DD148A|nr:DUF5689 domain-containing protein [Chitinophaga sp. XS-30]QEH39524.1 hypothetical protein FW415_01010 [Chitinophaga sp. XS-30]